MVGRESFHCLLKGKKNPELLTCEELEEHFGFTYSLTLTFESETTKERLKKRLERTFRSEEAYKKALWHFHEYRHWIEGFYEKKMLIKWVDETIGYGLFAKEKIKKWDYLAEYTGKVVAITPFTSMDNSYLFRYPVYGFHLLQFAIDGKKEGNLSRFINHGEKPNCEAFTFLQDNLLHIGLRAKEEIYPGTEILLHYGSYFSNLFLSY